MKSFEYYMSLPYTIIVKPSPEGGYVAKIAELPGCLTQGDTLDDAVKMIEDAKAGWIDLALQDGREIPEPNDEFSGRFNVRIPKSLHRELVARAKEENVSLNQLTTYLLSYGIGKGRIGYRKGDV
jgi:antitoxin HicB